MVMSALPTIGCSSEPETPSPFPKGPRKVIVGTSIFSVFPAQRPWVNLDHRLDEVEARFDEIAALSHRGHGRGPDIVIFPELSLNPNAADVPGPMPERAFPLDGAVHSRLSAMAKKHGAYLVVSFNLSEGEAISNAAVLFDRDGKLIGIYRKVFLTPKSDDSLEGGKVPGDSFPVFDTDFGRVGIAICFDMGFDEIMQNYADKGAELIVWPSMSPQTLYPRLYSRKHGFYMVSSTPRDNASVFDPAGQIVAQVTTEGPLIAEIDLDYELVFYQANFNNGQALRERYGDAVGFRYSDTEDVGIFWSNDPAKPIATMLSESGLMNESGLRAKARRLRARALPGE